MGSALPVEISIAVDNITHIDSNWQHHTCRKSWTVIKFVILWPDWTRIWTTVNKCLQYFNWELLSPSWNESMFLKSNVYFLTRKKHKLTVCIHVVPLVVSIPSLRIIGLNPNIPHVISLWVFMVRKKTWTNSVYTCCTTRSKHTLPEDYWAQSLYTSCNIFLGFHGDVTKWKHFPRYWPFVRGIHRSSLNSPHKGLWRGALMFLWSAPE